MLFENHFDCTAAGSWEDEHGYLMTCFIRFRECHVHGRGSRNIVLMTTVDMIMGRGVRTDSYNHISSVLKTLM